MALSKEAFLKRSGLKEVTLSDGQTVFLKPLPASWALKKGKDKVDDEEATGAVLISLSLCDEKGNLFFGEGDGEDVLNIPLADFGILSREIMALNGMQPVDASGASEAEKN